jgi:tetratricopeptide (TPR) repeat protein/predicted Ser/Thr protein kinase
LQLEQGKTIGRYVVLERIGKGGMGTVHAAYDPELDRKVAIKILHAKGTERDDLAPARLLREAQAIAQLSHPNVVTVYDVGLCEGHVFMAMEYVEGHTLREWVSEEKPSWREVVAVLRDAGRGLAAAHAVGLIHRDFKPNNLVLGRNGRVSVLDFGLARKAGSEDPVPVLSGESSSTTSGLEEPTRTLDEQITQFGVVLGTPAYMAPEQYRGKSAGPQSDQYSFCVTLWEALYGQRPFLAEDREGLTKAITFGRITEPPDDRGVPRWLRRVVQRGISRDPDARWPSMSALLAELDKDPARTRRWAAVAVGGIGLVAGAMLLAPRQAAAPKPCASVADAAQSIWNPERARASAQAFRATQKPWADAVTAVVDERMTAYLASWSEVRTDACEATRVRGEQSAELLDRRMACLDRRAEEASALADLLVDADVELAERAVTAVHGLSPLEPCSDTAALMARVPPPEDPELRERVSEVGAQLGRIKALSAAGRYPDAHALAKDAVAVARSTGHRPLEADALVLLADLQERDGDPKASEQTLYDAVVAAQAGEHRRAEVEAWINLIWSVGLIQDRHEEGRRFARFAQAGLEALGGDARTEAQILNHLGNVMGASGELDEATALHHRALELRRETLGDTHPAIGGTLNNLAILANMRGRHEESAELVMQALEIDEKTVGPDHPMVASGFSTLGDARRGAGQFDEAIAAYERAFEIMTAALGPDHPELIYPLSGLGKARLGAGAAAEAIETLERCLRLRGEAGELPHLLASVRFALARALVLDGRDPVRARTLATEAAATFRELGSDPEGLAEMEAWLRDQEQ